MAAIRIAYIGGGSTRAPGALASFVARGEDLAGSEICLIDLDGDRLDLVRRLAQRMAAAQGYDLQITSTTDRRSGLTDADAVLTSFRPGGFEARTLDERIPLSHGVIGQETQGPGGLFMAFRSIHVLKDIVADIESVCPQARIFNYTNPVNIVSQAISARTSSPLVSLCEGPILYPRRIAAAVGLDPDLLEVVCVGINHASWSVVHRYDGRDAVSAVRDAFRARAWNRDLTPETMRLLRIVDMLGSFPSGYFQYYFFERELARDLSTKPTTRAQDILASVPDYWKHYESQVEVASPVLDPAKSRGGITELELAVDAIDAVFNDKHVTLPVNVVNGGALPGFPDDLVVEVLGDCSAEGVIPLPSPAPLPHHLSGIVETLAEYQLAAAEAAWSGTRVDGLRALAMHPFVRSLDLAERIYDELAAAHSRYLPERLLT
jgi:6-phospho-beta-glucosidase